MREFLELQFAIYKKYDVVKEWASQIFFFWFAEHLKVQYFVTAPLSKYVQQQKDEDIFSETHIYSYYYNLIKETCELGDLETFL